MFKNFDKFWEENGFDILVGISIGIILINYFYREGKKGTWDKTFQRPTTITHTSNIYKSYTPTNSKDSKGEIECRRVLETIFKSPFPKTRPNILRNSVTSNDNTDFNLELDCYNQHLKIACEYNGAQHYKYIPHFHKSKDAFQNQKYRDYMKRDLCKKNGILLIEVPYTVKIEDIQDYIVKQLKDVGLL
jgi:hypothetical protein